MTIYPAIDLYEGKVVRLTKGDFNAMRVYHDRPAETARLWEDAGAKWLHLVNLNGARDSKLSNLDAVSKIRTSVNCRLQFGGGVRTLADIETLISLGIQRIILGSRALEPYFLAAAIERFPYRIAVGLDVMDGWVRTHGWTSRSTQSLPTALKNLGGFPLSAIIVTDIQRDGMLRGPNFDMISDCLKTARAPIILSGGVTTLNDVELCSQIQHPLFDGAIIGKALYERIFSLRDAIALTERARP